MRVTLVKPPERSKLNFGTFSLEVLASAITDIAFVDILDATNLPIGEAASQIVKKNSDFIGITTTGLDSVNAVCKFVEAIRQTGYKGQIAVGGHGASMMPQAILESGADVVVYGEGELTLREVLQTGISERVNGIYLLKDKHLVKTHQRNLVNLDELKEPARSLSPQPQNCLYILETSRGCPHSCSFCETSRFYSCTWRARSAENVVRDIHNLVEAGAMVILIADDNFTADTRRVMKICALLQNEPLPLFFFFSARSDDLIRDPTLIPSLAKANFLRANIGVETVIPAMAKSIGKDIGFEQHFRAFDAMRKAGIFTAASFIVGLPGETEDMRQSYVEAAVKLAPDTAIFLPFNPFLGTPLAKGDGKPEEWCIRYAARLTNEFKAHPTSVERLLLAAKEPTVRGMFARKYLLNLLKENVFSDQMALNVRKEVLSDSAR